MNRDQKAVAIEEIAAHIDESQAIFAVDYRGISVPQVAELRSKLREADATFKVVKNSLTERAADQAGAETLKEYLSGPTALTFVRGDAATAAKAIADYAKATQLLPFKGGLMDGAVLDVEQLRSLSRLPSREVLYGQLVGVVASPVGGLVRSLAALVGGLASALGQVQQKKESGEIPAGEAPAAAAPAAEEAPASEDAQPEAEAAPESETATDAEAAPEAEAASEAEAAPEPEAEAAPEASAPEAETTADDKAESADAPAQENENQADASAEAEQDPADANPTKED
ncbi:MAG TPA: 50S ribosomal protein L10 [Solirubrobacteraceae bacterium]|jgi:large subunit ribosomal protein L10|nr:50S ribosomal protein L10 [Solirubrobacteraceae bacterium]